MLLAPATLWFGRWAGRNLTVAVHHQHRIELIRAPATHWLRRLWTGRNFAVILHHRYRIKSFCFHFFCFHVVLPLFSLNTVPFDSSFDSREFQIFTQCRIYVGLSVLSIDVCLTINTNTCSSHTHKVTTAIVCPFYPIHAICLLSFALHKRSLIVFTAQ